MARKPPTLRQKLASALLMMVTPDDTGKMVPVIPFARAMKMTADQIIAEFDFDHAVYVAIGGGNEPWNLTPRLRAEHREKTKRDLANIAKVKRGLKKRAQQNCPSAIAWGDATAGRSTDEADETGEYARTRGVNPRRAKARSSVKSAKKTRPKIPGSKGTPYRKKINGTVERRV